MRGLSLDASCVRVKLLNLCGSCGMLRNRVLVGPHSLTSAHL